MDAGPPLAGDDMSGDGEGSVGKVGETSIFSCKAEVGIVCGCRLYSEVPVRAKKRVFSALLSAAFMLLKL